MGFLSNFRDGLLNVVAGLGTGQGKGDFTTYSVTIVSAQMAENAYSGGPWLRKIVDVPAFDMTREWRDWQAEDSQIELIEAIEKKHAIVNKVREGIQWGRLYGGAALVLGINEDDMATPLDLESVSTDSLAFVHCLSRYQFKAEPFQNDPISPFYGMPEFYTINDRDGRQRLIHASRMIRFIGNDLPPGTMREMNEGWGESIYAAVGDAIRNSDVALRAMGELLLEAKADVIKIPGLMEGVATAEYESRLMTRLTLAARMKSLTNALVVDGEEEWETRQVNFGGIPDVAKTIIALLAGAADIPATRLLGQSPQGMNATGDSDTRNYYDMLRARQNDMTRTTLATLDEVIIRSALGARDPSIYYEWSPLWQMDPEKRAGVDKTKAETAKIWLDTGLMPTEALAEAVANMLIEDATYPGLESALEDAGEEAVIPALEEPEPMPMLPPGGVVPPGPPRQTVRTNPEA